MEYLVPGTVTKLLSKPSKMPSASWSIPAHRACPGAVYGEGTICGVCYAQKGRYAFANVTTAQERRFNWTRESLKTAEGRDAWVALMVAAIRRATRKVKYFRVHDSGDLFSPQYTLLWRRVCQELPEVAFWFPTRNWHAGVNVLLRGAVLELSKLPNVTVRPSALLLDAAPPEVEGLQGGSGARRVGYNCPAHEQNNECRECRMCWDAKEVPITYRLH